MLLLNVLWDVSGDEVTDLIEQFAGDLNKRLPFILEGSFVFGELFLFRKLFVVLKNLLNSS